MPADSESSSPQSEELKAQLRESKQDFIESQRALASARNHVDRLKADLEKCHKHIADLGSRIDFLNSQIECWQAVFKGIVNSKSWKLTAPFRYVFGLFRRAGQFGRLDKPHGESTQLRERVSSNTSPDEPVSSLLEEAAPASDRKDLLEQAWQELRARAGDSTGDGRYIHPVSDRIDTRLLDVKAIAFYSQQSPDSRGGVFSWTDVSKALPRYRGHYQPHLPDALGFYDLRVPGVLRKQVELASRYGIHGFCFELSELPEAELTALPLRQLLADPELEITFCVSCSCEVSCIQKDSWLRFLASVFADPRYIRIDGRPLLVVSSTSDEATPWWPEQAAAMGLAGLYIAVLCPLNRSDALTPACDAVIDDPIREIRAEATKEIPLIDPDFRGRIYSYAAMMETQRVPVESPHVVFRNVVTGWDDEAKKPGEGRSFAGASPTLYARWLERCCRLAMSNRPQERLLFISSWNNWTEGAHLEPDRRFGYAYLHATANVLRCYHRDNSTEALINDINSSFSPTSDAAIVFHCFYEDLIGPIFERYLSKARGVDLIVTVRSDISQPAVEEMRKNFPNIYFLRYENRGRDIRPFLLALQCVQEFGYRVACKVHTKKTPQVQDGGGELWRLKLMDQLLGVEDSLKRVVRRFDAEKSLGLLVPKVSVEDLRQVRNHVDNTFWLDRLLADMHRTDLIGNYGFCFPAGSMFWFRVEALAGFDTLAFPEDAFEPELGQRDGTLAHALERMVCLYALQRGYQTGEIDVTEGDNLSVGAVAGTTYV